MALPKLITSYILHRAPDIRTLNIDSGNDMTLTGASAGPAD